jgi:hypothetical protein
MRTRNPNPAIAVCFVAFAALSASSLPAGAQTPPASSAAPARTAIPPPEATAPASTLPPPAPVPTAATARPPIPAASPLGPPPSPEPVTGQPLRLEPSVKRRTVALYAAGIAVVGAGVATVFGVLALNNKHEYEKTPTYSNSDNGNNDAAYADGGIALAVAAGITSLVLLLTSDPADASPTASAPATRSGSHLASPTATSLSSGGGAGALLRF